MIKADLEDCAKTLSRVSQCGDSEQAALDY